MSFKTAICVRAKVRYRVSFEPLTLDCTALVLGLGNAFPSVVRSCQALALYPALADGIDNDRIGRANFIGVGYRGFSGIVHRFKVACGRGQQDWSNAWGGRFGKIADPKFHASKIKRQSSISKANLCGNSCRRHTAAMGLTSPQLRRCSRVSRKGLQREGLARLTRELHEAQHHSFLNLLLHASSEPFEVRR